MVTVTGINVRQNADGKNYVTLTVTGDVVAVQSLASGRHYLTAKKATMFCTFDEEQAKSLIGKQIPGSIERVQTDGYSYTLPESGEVIQLNHRWDYTPLETSAVVPQRSPELVG
jgi:hypothetical protein